MTPTTPLLSVPALAARLESQAGRASSLVVLEATKYLPGQEGDAERDFAAERIRGARYFDVDAIADTESPLPHMLPAPGRFARLVGALGIGPESEIVVYDRGPMYWASRVWWMFAVMGHDKVHVLDGGWSAWRAAGGAVETGLPAPVTPARFVPTPRAARLRGIGDVIDNLASRAELVVDARPAPRFRGEAPELRPGLRAGHIPGARNLPAASLLAADGTLLPPAALAPLLAAAGIDGTRPVIASCGSGV